MKWQDKVYVDGIHSFGLRFVPKVFNMPGMDHSLGGSRMDIVTVDPQLIERQLSYCSEYLKSWCALYRKFKLSIKNVLSDLIAYLNYPRS